MFLEVVLDTRNVRSDFLTITETDTSDLADSRVRLARSLSGYASTYATLERRIVVVRVIFNLVETRVKGTRLTLPSRVLSLTS